MALTAAQYRTMRDLFRGRLSVDSSNPTDGDVLTFFKQFLIDAAGFAALSNDQQAKAGRIANEVLSGNFSNPSDVNIVDFWTALATDANAGSAMGATAQYQTMQKAMVGMFACDFFNPTLGSILSYINFFGLSFSVASFFPGAYQVLQTDKGLTYGSTPLATAGNTSATVLTLGGSTPAVAVPVLAKATNTATVGSGALFSISFDGGSTFAMTGVALSPTPTALTGAGAGLTLAATAASSVTNDTWKATAAALADQTANGKNAAQASASLQPVVTVGLNGRVGLLFDGVDDFMQSSVGSLIGSSTPYQIVVLGRYVPGPLINQALVGSPVSLVGVIYTAALNLITPYNAGAGPTLAFSSSSPARFSGKYSNSGGTDTIIAGSGSNTGAGGAGGADTNRNIACNNASLFANVEIFAVVYTPQLSLAAFDASINTSAGYGVASFLV